MKKFIGKKFTISGMTLEVVSDSGENWETRNITTQEIVLMNKSALERAIKLGMAEEISGSDEQK